MAKLHTHLLHLLMQPGGPGAAALDPGGWLFTNQLFSGRPSNAERNLKPQFADHPGDGVRMLFRENLRGFPTVKATTVRRGA